MMGVSAVIGLIGAKKQGDANNKAAKIQQQEIDQQASVAMVDRVAEGRAARASARAAAAESGVSGNSLDSIINDAYMQTGKDVSIIEKNRQNGIASSVAENGARNSAVNAEAGTQVINAGLSAYSNHTKLKISKEAPVG